ncbi:MAG: COX15/CtaA family protein [Bdellovibrionaceae bacterium]|nr:COX15/CtaA family protein [Pseudobdellovibrionaceae bacterium]
MRSRFSFFKKYSLFTIIFTLITIFWGAWVRLSFSGDGCGKSWPLCENKIFPENIMAFIEWLHRLSSGLSFIFIFILFLLSIKFYSKGHGVRKFSGISFVLVCIEALIGAILVLSGLVSDNTEKIRVLVLAVHSVNSLLLVGSLSLSYKMSLWENRNAKLNDGLRFKKPLIYFLYLFPLLALTGNIASLAGQLFPSESLSSALALDLLPSAHTSLKIRPFHPLLAIAFLLGLCVFSYFKKYLIVPTLAVFGVVLFGFFTLFFLSPLWMKIAHLILAYCLWIFLIAFSVERVKV